MHGDPIGNVWIAREFKHTTHWPGMQYTLKGHIDLEKEYKEALAGQLVQVLEDGGDCYLVYAECKSFGGFIWTIEKGDTKGFVPIIKKNGIIMPAGMGLIEEMIFTVKAQAREMKYYNKTKKRELINKWADAGNLPRKKKKRMRKAIASDYEIFSWLDEDLIDDED